MTTIEWWSCVRRCGQQWCGESDAKLITHWLLLKLWRQSLRSVRRWRLRTASESNTLRLVSPSFRSVFDRKAEDHASKQHTGQPHCYISKFTLYLLGVVGTTQVQRFTRTKSKLWSVYQIRDLKADTYRVGQLKWGQLTFLLALECVDKILCFLANLITV